MSELLPEPELEDYRKWEELSESINFREEQDHIKSKIDKYLFRIFKMEGLIIDDFLDEEKVEKFIYIATNDFTKYRFSHWIIKHSSEHFLKNFLKNNYNLLKLMNLVKNWERDTIGTNLMFPHDKDITMAMIFDNYCYYYVTQLNGQNFSKIMSDFLELNPMCLDPELHGLLNDNQSK